MQPLGPIGYKDRPVFDHKMTLQDDFKFNGVKDGYKWKGKVESYFMSCAPVMMEILRWAERQNLNPIKWETVSYAVGAKMAEDQAQNMVTQLWGFLAAVVPGSAGTMFKRADQSVGEMNGIDARRRLARHIGHGGDLRLGDPRHEIQPLHISPIKSMQDVEQ